MSEVFPKFIIEDGNLILSKVTFHKQIVTDPEKVRGGGWFYFKNNTFTFHGDSHDFGKAKLTDIQECIKNKNVYTNICCTHSIADNYSFAYDTGSEIIPL